MTRGSELVLTGYQPTRHLGTVIVAPRPDGTLQTDGWATRREQVVRLLPAVAAVH